MLVIKSRHPYQGTGDELRYEALRERLEMPKGDLPSEVQKAYLDAGTIDYLTYKARGKI